MNRSRPRPDGRRPTNRSAWLLLGLSGLVPTACSAGEEAGLGQVSFVLTDAASDELEIFEVDVTGIGLTNAGGSTVSVLAKTSRIDFVELESLADLLVGRALAAGFYTGMTLQVDFANAVVCLKGQTTPATVVDASGATISGTVDVQVTFPSGSRPQVLTRRNHLWAIDLDLEQAITVDQTNNRVTFAPTLSATLDPGNPKPVRAFGSLGTVDTAARTFVLQRLATDDTVLASFTVRSGNATVFQVDGSVYTGAAGLGVLALRASSAPQVYVQGVFDRSDRVLDAALVETGAGTRGNGQDWVIGHIVGRSAGAGTDANLTVVGRSRDVGSNVRQFNTQHTVAVSLGQTKVLRRGSGSVIDTDALNIGQAIIAFGDLTGTTLAAGAAENGVVRMLPTSVFGIAQGSAANDELVLDVRRFDLRDVSDFDFAIGGNPEADPMAYRVRVAGLGTTGISSGSKIRAIGFVNPVGVMNDADFTAASLVDRSNTARVLLCAWVPPQAGVITSATQSALTLDVANAAVKTVGDGFGPVTLQAAPAPTIAPLGNRGIYLIVQEGAVEAHAFFSTYAAALDARLATNAEVVRISGIGTFDESTQVFQALTTTVVLR